MLVSPFATQEESRAALAVAKALGVEALFVSPAENDLKDDLLHTGDPCPNRRGLTDLGFTAVTPEDAILKLAGSQSALLIGERIGSLLGAPLVTDGLAGLSSALRMVVFDIAAPDSPAARVCVPIPNWAEKAGTTLNVDGHEGRIAPARSAPAGVRSLESNLKRLTELLTSTEASA